MGGVTGNIDSGLGNIGSSLGKGVGDLKDGLGNVLGNTKDALGGQIGNIKNKLGEFSPDKLANKGNEKLNDITKKIQNTNLLDIKNTLVKFFCSAKKLFEKEKTSRERSMDYIKKLLEMFKNLDYSSLDLLKMLITNYTLHLSNKLMEKDPQRYNMEQIKLEKELEEEKKNKRKQKIHENDINLNFANNLFAIRKKFFIFHFEEFLIVLLKYIRFIVGIQAKLEFLENGEIFVYLFLHKKALPIIAESFNYELQCKPYADQYRSFLRKKFEKGTKKKLLFKEEEVLLVSLLRENENFEDLNHNDQMKFPPYFPYEVSKHNKFRKYWNDDDYHVCYKDVECRKYQEILKDQKYQEENNSEEEGDDNINGLNNYQDAYEYIDYNTYSDDEDKLCNLSIFT